MLLRSTQRAPQVVLLPLVTGATRAPTVNLRVSSHIVVLRPHRVRRAKRKVFVHLHEEEVGRRVDDAQRAPVDGLNVMKAVSRPLGP